MKKHTTIKLAACATIAFMSQVVLPLSAAELAHRWSFNGDYSDSVGGVDAVKCGTYVSLYGGRVHMGYGACSHGTGYVDLGTNMLDTTAATIEIWARHDGVESWSRVFDYGADNTHYFMLCWTYGTNLNKDRAGAKNPGETATDGTMSPYEIGTDYYIAVTFEQQGEATLVKWQRRDAMTGELQKSGTMTMPDGIQKIVDPVLYLGHSQYASDKDALAAYDEVRIWRGVLTDAQLAASAAAGPDAAIIVAADVPQFRKGAKLEVSLDRIDRINKIGKTANDNPVNPVNLVQENPASPKLCVRIPLADGNPDSRVYAYEVVVIGEAESQKLFKSVYAAGCNMGIGHEPNGGVTTLEIAKDELPLGKTLTFAVRPLTSLGTSGKAIATEFKV